MDQLLAGPEYACFPHCFSPSFQYGASARPGCVTRDLRQHIQMVAIVSVEFGPGSENNDFWAAFVISLYSRPWLQ